MATLKNLFVYLLVLFFLFCGKLIFAQKAMPNSSWMTGIDVGINIDLACNDCRENVTITSMFTNSAFVHFRLKRWFGFTLNAARYHQHFYANGSLFDAESNLIPLTQRDYRINKFDLSIGPQLLLRIGQGDLGLEVRFGRALSTTTLNASTIGGQSYDIKYKSIIFNSESYRIGYTYWPKPRFGVSVNLESTLVFRPQSTSIEHSPKTPFEEAYPNDNSETLGKLAPRVYSADFINITVGFTYRFK